MRGGESSVLVVFDRHHKIWNATESAGFPADVAAALVRDKVAHYPAENEAPAPALQPSGTRTSGRESCGRCGTFFAAGTAHTCPAGAPAAGQEVFSAGFPEASRGRRGGKRRRGGA